MSRAGTMNPSARERSSALSVQHFWGGKLLLGARPFQGLLAPNLSLKGTPRVRGFAATRVAP